MSAGWKTFPDKVTAAEACGAHILARLETALASKPSATLAVSGGASPKPMFEFMARTDFDWSRVHLFWVDERAVPPDHEQSNYRFVEECLIRPAAIPERNVHRVYGELPPEEAAARYRDDLISHVPRFDVIHLGMGADAHTASLFPGEPLIDDRDGLAAAVYVSKIPQWRITLLPGVLLAAQTIALLVTGKDKAPVLPRVFGGEYLPLEIPVQMVASEAPHAIWFFDQPAASNLQRR